MENMYNRLKLVTLILVIACIVIACKQDNKQFTLEDSSKTNVEFSNVITESDSFNIITYEYIYNGGGVAVADFNNDGLQDLYFTGNMVDNKLYLNRGDFEFEDITNVSNTNGEGKWCSGVAVIDINNDGWRDLYVCATAHPDDERRENLLYINQGPNKDGVPTFVNRAGDYGIDDNSHTTNAAFLDYDNDGDLDLFLVVNKMEKSGNPNIYKKRDNNDPERIDKLFRNDWNAGSAHPVFVDVSRDTGIIYEGYGLGVNVTDLNQDGWKDIYVTNDYISTDLTYINQKDGTFKNMSDHYFKHTSHSAMGNDVNDLNNDGYPDVVVLDMMPEDNLRKKTMTPANNYSTYIYNEQYDYQYQYMRNTLQLNHGPGTNGQLSFSEIGLFSGISSTDWSWTPLISDFDNDGHRDLIVTNGFPRDVTDHDYVEFLSDVGPYASNTLLLSKMPSIKIKNYAYRNSGDGTFTDVTDSWGVEEPSFSNGAAYGDLDNDGDLDYVVNNINDKAFVYRNTAIENKSANNWLRIKLEGTKNNPAGMGAVLKAYHGGQMIYYDHSIYRGYLSSMEEIVHFGLGRSSKVDSLIVFWPGGRLQKEFDVQANQVLELNISQASYTGTLTVPEPNVFFKEVSHDFNSLYKHQEDEYIDFNIQPLLPHKLSQYGPAVAVADVNGDGLDDVYFGGSHFYKGTLLVQNPDNSFAKEDLFPEMDEKQKKEEELGVLFFDADNDGDQDLYLVSGGYEFEISDSLYQDRFFENVQGKFELRKNSLPPFLSSGSCVKAADFDRDGDLDLFVGGRVLPRQYPKPVDSYVLVNKSVAGSIQFEIADIPELVQMGMVCDALWSDFNGDGWVDLIVAGEWMPLRFFVNEKGTLKEMKNTGIDDRVGWWNSLASGDFDRDGDMDYLAGNLGLNTFFKAYEEYPISIYAADFDGNKGYDIVPAAYFKSQEGKLKEYPFFNRLDMQKQIIKVKADYLKHTEFGKATISDILNPAQIDSALVYQANYMRSAFIENQGNNRFVVKSLPLQCQVAPIYGMLVDDFNSDGYEDVLLVGNDFGTELTTGRYDAFNGLMLSWKEDGFHVIDRNESGFHVPGDAKALATLVRDSGEQLIIGSQNQDVARVFSFDRPASTVINLLPDDFVVEVTFKDGSVRKSEVYYGHTYLSQSSRKLIVPKEAAKVEITNYQGIKREHPLDQLAVDVN